MIKHTVNIKTGEDWLSGDRLAQSRSIFADRPDADDVLLRGPVAQKLTTSGQFSELALVEKIHASSTDGNQRTQAHQPGQQIRQPRFTNAEGEVFLTRRFTASKPEKR